MDFYDDDIDNICDWVLVCDRIDIGVGRGYLIVDKAVPYGVLTIIIYIYGEGGDGVGIGWYLYVMYM